MSKKSFFGVSEVARMAKISVRALHHYDEVGLLRPTGRSQAGYRLYSAADLRRLQQVMSFKVLGFPLEEIRRVLDDPKLDVRAALLLQRKLLAEKKDELQTLIAAVDGALAALTKGRKMESEKMFDPFQNFDPSIYEEEAKQRFSETDAYRESSRRAARYTPAQWAELKGESERIYRDLAALLESGVPPADPRAMELAERHRLHIERWFYPCSKRMHRGLGEMYVSDSRFTKSIDRHRIGLAAFLREAIAANDKR